MFLFTVSNIVTAQGNTSYNLNSVPISGNFNTAYGRSCLSNYNAGSYNTALGYFCLTKTNSGYMNTAIGVSALYENFSGVGNVAIGQNALSIGTNPMSNTAIGNYALMNSNSYGNTAVGNSSLSNNVSGKINTAFGMFSLHTNYSGESNTANGANSLNNNNSGSNNVAMGENSLSGNISGNFNTAIGKGADVTLGNFNNATAIGYNAKVNASNTIQLGNSDVTHIYAGINAKVVARDLQITGGTIVAGSVLTSDAFGNATWELPSGGGGIGNGWSLSGNNITTGNFIGTTNRESLDFKVNNIYAGRICGIFGFGVYGVQGGGADVFLGLNSGINHNNGSTGILTALTENVGIGRNSQKSSIVGGENTSVGAFTLENNVEGYANTAIGYSALQKNISIANTAVGSFALNNLVNGGGNSSLGVSSLVNLLEGNSNTSVGSAALSDLTKGDNNSAFGNRAEIFGFSNNNTLVGAYSLIASSISNPIVENSTSIGSFSLINFSSNNSTSLGYQAITNISNKIRLGDANVIQVEGPVVYTPSDERFKFDISERDVKGLEFIKKLRPVVYKFDTKKFTEFLTESLVDSVRQKYLNKDFEKSTAIRQSGFIAQEVEIAANEVGYDFNGLHKPESKNDNYSLAYAQFVVPLVKAVQELNGQNTALKQAKEEQAIINESLKKDIAELKEMISAQKNNIIEGSIKITEATNEAKLFQNAPNPFSKTTTIKYSLPASAKRAAISITNMDGVKIKTFVLNNKNGETLNINGGELSAGTYVYTLMVDDVFVDSKKMILTK